VYTHEKRQPADRSHLFLMYRMVPAIDLTRVHKVICHRPPLLGQKIPRGNYQNRQRQKEQLGAQNNQMMGILEVIRLLCGSLQDVRDYCPALALLSTALNTAKHSAGQRLGSARSFAELFLLKRFSPDVTKYRSSRRDFSPN
jgi:hypothetical protein